MLLNNDEVTRIYDTCGNAIERRGNYTGVFSIGSWRFTFVSIIKEGPLLHNLAYRPRTIILTAKLNSIPRHTLSSEDDRLQEVLNLIGVPLNVDPVPPYPDPLIRNLYTWEWDSSGHPLLD